MATTDNGFLLVLAIMVPFVGVLVGFMLGGRNAVLVAKITILASLFIVIVIATEMIQSGRNLVYLIGGWTPPLGVALRADNLALVMMLTVAVVTLGIASYAHDDFSTPPGVREARVPFIFWNLLLAISGSLNLVFLSGDLFTLYVALELLTFAAVPLVSLDGQAETLRAALRYLLFALLGSVFYLLGTVLLYGTYGTLDIPLLADRLKPDLPVLTAAGLMTTGLLAKTALVPLHLWLPPAHAGAPAAASAVLSGLVIKGSWFLVVRLWFDVLPGVPLGAAAQLIGGLGAAAILLGNVVALRQGRLKLLVAYSTVAQIGYLFLMFPLAFGSMAVIEPVSALTAGMLQAIAHATAKAAMFMVTGLIYKVLGHDRIKNLAGIGRVLPLSVLTFVLSGMALMGLPPSGAYVAKKLLLNVSIETGQWWWDMVMQVGGFLTAGYVVLVLAHALTPAPHAIEPPSPISRVAEIAAFALALCSLLLGFAAAKAGVPDALSEAWTTKEFLSALLLILGGAVVAVSLAPQLPTISTMANPVVSVAGAIRRVTLAAGAIFVRTDRIVRQWPVAGVWLVTLTIAIGAAMAMFPRS